MKVLFMQREQRVKKHNSCIYDKEMQETMRAQIEEIEKFKWYLGERIGHDPLKDMSMNEICNEWIRKNAQTFREHREIAKRNKAS